MIKINNVIFTGDTQYQYEIHLDNGVIDKPLTEEEMLLMINGDEFIRTDEYYLTCNEYLKEYCKEFYEKYKLLFND